jgi:D-lactate dehydrogenase
MHAGGSAKAFLHRFVAAGAAVRYRAVHRREVEDIVALDALPRNTREWRERLPQDLADKTIHALYYGHFFCQVFHQDYIVRKGTDPLAFEHALWALLDARGRSIPPNTTSAISTSRGPSWNSSTAASIRATS